MYASSWFVTLFASTLSLNVVYRIMDAFLVDVSAAGQWTCCVGGGPKPVAAGNTCFWGHIPLPLDSDGAVLFSPAGLAGCVQGGLGTAALQLQ